MVIRGGTLADSEALARFNGFVHCEPTLDELLGSFPDCPVERDASAAIATALCPRRVSNWLPAS